MKLIVKRERGSSGRVHLVDAKTFRGLMSHREEFYWTTVEIVDVPSSQDKRKILIDRGYNSLDLDVPDDEFNELYRKTRHIGALGELESFKPSDTPTLKKIIEMV